MTKTLRRVVSVVAALAVMMLMVVPFGTAPSAPQKAWGDDTGTITITPPDGTQSNAKTTYNIYRIFDASPASDGNAVSYKLVSGKTTVPDVEKHMPSGETYDPESTPHFILDTSNQVYYGTESTTKPTSGNEGVDYARISKQSTSSTTADTYVIYKKDAELSQAAIDAIAEYVGADKTPPETPTYSVTATGKDNAVQSGVPFGYYYVTTTTGSVVSVGTVNRNPDIKDKNEVPTVDKTITTVSSNSVTTATEAGASKDTNEGSVTTDGKAAIAQVGSKVWYTATVTFGKGSKNVKFHDKMDEGLQYVPGSASVTIIRAANGDNAAADTLTKTGGDYYTIQETPDEGDTITIKFGDGLDALGTADKPVVKAIITYSATVTSAFLSVNPTKNTAKVSYGDPSNFTQESSTYVYNAKIVVTKTDGSNAPLAGAGFKLSRSVNGATQYYKFTAETNDTPAIIDWVSDANDATELKTKNGDGGNILTFAGLPDGTYTLTESTVPTGYNKAPDAEVTVNGVSNVTKAAAEADGSYLLRTGEGDSATIANLNQAKTVVNNMGSALPHAGGPGTIWLYVIGGVLVAAAAVGLIARRRMRQN